MMTGRRLVAAAAVSLIGLCVAVPTASATTATANLAAGSLGFINSTPGNVTFSGTLTGADQTLTATQPFDVSDATGSGSGWNVTATSTTFTNASKTLPTSATTVTTAPTTACDSGSTCTVASNQATYPYTLPAGGTAPTATMLFDANTNTGMGNQTVTPTWKLAVPSGAKAGAYTSTWTFTLASNP